MLDQEKLIGLLNQPGVHSGRVLGEALGVSRVAVQKKIQALIDIGLPVTAVSGKGYSLHDGVRLLDEQDIRNYLHCESPGQLDLIDSIEVFQSIASTNSYLLGQPVLPGRAKVCVSESQSAGRGRRGNDWQSAPYRNIMFSLSWGFASWPATITGLGLAVALALVERLNVDLGLDIEIKWPNDLMVDDDKLAGVLVDVAGESSGACNVVIGVGLNVHQPDWSESQGSGYKWQDLHGLGVDIDRNRLLSMMVGSLTAMLQEFTANGFAPMADRWNQKSSYVGRRVQVGERDDVVVGQMIGVDALGALLLVDDDGGQHSFSESTVSVRLV